VGRAACALVFHSGIAEGAARRLSLGCSWRHRGAACTAQHHRCFDVRCCVLSSAAQGGAPSYTCLRNPFTAGCLDGLTQPTQMLLCHCLCPFSGGYLQGNMLLKQGRLPVQVRFIFPVLLLFNIAAAAGLARLHQNRSKGQRERLAWWAALALLAASTAASFGMAAVSQANYPGGHALYRLHTIVDAAPEACRLPSTYTHAISGLYAWPHSDAAPLDHRRLLG